VPTELRVPGWIDNNWLRIAGYLVVAALTLVAARREDPNDPATWRPFWFLTGGLLLAMALGRAIDLGDLAGDELRAQARSGGWYESRRKFQSVVVAGLVVAWLAMVFTAVWRVPERRRRYLPMIVAVVTLAAYAAIRVVSLHHIDALLYRRSIGDIRYGIAIEFAMLTLAAFCTLSARRSPTRRPTAARPRRPTQITSNR
jgi:hypothetical protein